MNAEERAVWIAVYAAVMSQSDFASITTQAENARREANKAVIAFREVTR